VKLCTPLTNSRYHHMMRPIEEDKEDEGDMEDDSHDHGHHHDHHDHSGCCGHEVGGRSSRSVVDLRDVACF